MQVILIILPLILLWVLFLQHRYSLRSAFVASSVVWAVFITLLTELLSVLGKLSYPNLVVSWCGVCGVLIYFIRRVKANRCSPTSRLNLFLRILIAGIIFNLLIIAFIALVSPPNTGDVLAYHMSRVIHWIANQTVYPYPSHIRSQLYQPPWAEFAITHLQILSGGDRFANMIEWFGFLGSIITVSLITERLKGGVREQVFSATVCATVPIAILTASSAKNSCILSFWVLCFIYYSLVVIQEAKSYRSLSFSLLSASLGLAIVTKGTAYIYCLPFLIWLIGYLFSYLPMRALPPLLYLGIIILSLSLPYYLRNISIYGAPLGTVGTDDTYSNHNMGITTPYSNVLRNISLQLATPWIPFNQEIEKVVKWLHDIWGLDVNDPATTWANSKGYQINEESLNEVSASNPFHTLLFLCSLGWYTCSKKLWRDKYLMGYISCVIATGLLFCWLLQWQPWHTRLLLTFFFLISPWLGIFLGRFVPKTLGNITLIILLLLSTPYLFYSATRPIIPRPYVGSILTIPRIEQYFNGQIWQKEIYLGAAELLKKHDCYDIGLFSRSDQDGWEYALWQVMSDNNHQVRIKHIKLENPSQNFVGVHEAENFTPCGIFVVAEGKTAVDMEVDNYIYKRRWLKDSFAVLLKENKH